MKLLSRQVRYFLVLVKVLHFGKAAAMLNLAQPALSRAINELEDQIGIKLFHRTTRYVELTEAGRLLAEGCELADEYLQRSATLAKRVSQGDIGTLRIGYNDFAINGRLPDFIRLFRHHHPEIRVEMNFHSTSVQQSMLLNDQIDVAFMIGPFQADNVHSLTFEHNHYVALLPSGHPLSGRSELQLVELMNENFVLGNPEEWFIFRNLFFDLCKKKGFMPNLVQEASSTEGIFGMVAAGTGVSIHSSSILNRRRHGVNVVRIADITDEIPIISSWKDNRLNPVLRIFVEFLKNL
ncbi:LysR family transcriptional regulator [Pseudochrobactrum sp. sp1633]|uniref:LysR family transcriptional regulator n=1 Tax=Pseudochrobactrum sp. sp1633 TaxID=3036706 RepID=UPI0025A4E3BD|nr:LysR family transcriptional regulator [Pseudochrobactrum sp. sp1633]MDM8347176.1 LysR family transcriptional regulator [Pseudochrobactrum sp. sp1633]